MNICPCCGTSRDWTGKIKKDKYCYDCAVFMCWEVDGCLLDNRALA